MSTGTPPGYSGHFVSACLVTAGAIEKWGHDRRLFPAPGSRGCLLFECPCHGIDVEAQRITPEFRGNTLGWNDLIEFLVEQGADIDARDRYGATPLMIALGDPEGRYYRQVGSVNYDLRFRRPGTTPGTGENMEVAELLLALGAEPFTGEYRDASGL